MKRGILIFAIAVLLLISCSQSNKLAHSFVDRSRHAKVALYVPDTLIKTNLRYDSIPAELDTLSQEEKDEYLRKKIRVLNDINDAKFIDILYFAMESELHNYGLIVEYWNEDSLKADSVHWVVDIPQIEITEFVDRRTSASEYYNQMAYITIPVDIVNVATWFNLNDGITTDTAFIDNNFTTDFAGYLEHDSDGKIIAVIKADSINVEGLYRYAGMLGKLYAGYCYDYLMNGYINSKTKSRDTLTKFRFDPYENTILKTKYDYLMPMRQQISCDSLSQ